MRFRPKIKFTYYKAEGPFKRGAKVREFGFGQGYITVKCPVCGETRKCFCYNDHPDPGIYTDDLMNGSCHTCYSRFIVRITPRLIHWHIMIPYFSWVKGHISFPYYTPPRLPAKSRSNSKSDITRKFRIRYPGGEIRELTTTKRRLRKMLRQRGLSIRDAQQYTTGDTLTIEFSARINQV